jgi:hypothetical protein
MTLEIQRAKENTPTQKYNHELSATVGVYLRLAEAADPKDGVSECIKGDAWFESHPNGMLIIDIGHRYSTHTTLLLLLVCCCCCCRVVFLLLYIVVYP